MKAFAHIVLGFFLGFIAVCFMYVFNFEAILPPRLMCGMKTADGCMVWVDKIRKERYEAGKAGT